MLTTNPAAVRLKPGEERRLRGGHPWIFSNEIEGSLRGLEPGSLVEARTAGGEFVGIGAYNPHSLIAVRLLTRRKREIDDGFFDERIAAALRRRRALSVSGGSFRLAFSESDGLPGFVADLYERVAVVQSHSLGTDRWLERAVGALERAVRPAGVLLRNDSSLREIEELPREVKVLSGRVPERITIRQGEARFVVDPWRGHKTGFYLDQSDNRPAAAARARDARVLDICCYTGAFAVQCALAGAREVIGIDSSVEALALARENAELNGVAGRCRFIEGDAFEFLAAGHDPFDMIVLDPPSFARHKRQVKPALKGYVKLEALALSRLTEEGILAASSCSYHVDAGLFRGTIEEAAEKAGIRLWLLERRSQARDHPVLLAMPETEYLKFLLLRGNGRDD